MFHGALFTLRILSVGRTGVRVCVGVDVVFIYVEPCCAMLCHVATPALLCVGVAQADVKMSEDSDKEFDDGVLKSFHAFKCCACPCKADTCM